MISSVGVNKTVYAEVSVVRIPVVSEISGAGTHSVAVFAEEEGLVSFGILAVVVAPCGVRVHSALDIRNIAEVLAVVVVVVCAFVVYDSGGVA